MGAGPGHARRRRQGVRRLPESAGAREVAELRLGKKAAEQLAEAEKLQRRLDRYAYGPPPVRFTDADVDQARAAGVLIEFDGTARPIIVDRARCTASSSRARSSARTTTSEAKAAAAAKEKSRRRPSAPPTR